MSVRRTFAIISLAFAWLCANGALWDAMQVFAWGKMLAGYSETMALGQALQETFDPTKPCDMCVGISKAKETAQQQQQQPPLATQHAAAKFLLALHIADAPVFSRDPGDWPDSFSLTSAVRTDPVPLPPPRC